MAAIAAAWASAAAVTIIHAGAQHGCAETNLRRAWPFVGCYSVAAAASMSWPWLADSATMLTVSVSAYLGLSAVLYRNWREHSARDGKKPATTIARG